MNPADGRPASGRTLVGPAAAALAVVYGDIGTSPLYALKEAFGETHGVAPTAGNILGVLSLVFWSLTFVVSFKYISVILRADNRGEGGTMALLALARPEAKPRGRGLIVTIGLFGAALLFGDGVITPAISVLGAVEGIRFAAPALTPWIVPLAMVIISLLFYVQRRGTTGVARIFGPITVIWFICLAALGIRGIAMHWQVLAALNPWHALSFFMREGITGIVVLGAVVLVITGGEALYADLGHFGRAPIRLAWFAVVLPALVLNYFGQGALLLIDPAAAVSPFYALVPGWALNPMIVIATCAAVVASQALISGAFSLAQQAMQLGFLPRLRLIHTSRTAMGQVYMPGVNAALWVACIMLVLGFRSSGALAATYGVAVTGTMFVTSILFAVVAKNLWQWPTARVVAVTALFLLVDGAFLVANLMKIPHGGWFPIMAAGVVFLMMTTWKRGRRQVTAFLTESSLPLDLIVPDLASRNLPRVSGTAVFMSPVEDVAPPVLLHHLKHNKVLHERVVLMTVLALPVPQAPEGERLDVVPRGEGIFSVKARYGFMETPDIPAVLEAVAPLLATDGVAPATLRMATTSFYLGRETIVLRPRGHGAPRAADEMWGWRARLFAVMSRNAQTATAFFGLPPNRVVELGAQVQI